MPVLKLEIDVESFNRLAEIAVNERRPIPLQAEVLLLTSIGRWPVQDCPCPIGRSQAMTEASQ
jgi:hypothetical protein